MAVSSFASKIKFTNTNQLPTGNDANPLLEYLLTTPSGLSTAQIFLYNEVTAQYESQGNEPEVIGTWNPRTDTPSHLTTLTTNGQALVVTAASDPDNTTDVNGFNTWRVGDLLVRNNGIYYKDPRSSNIIGALSENTIPILRNGLLQDSSLSSDADTLVTSKVLEIPQGTLRSGTTSEIKEYGGLPGIISLISNNVYLPTLQVLDEGSIIPVPTEQAFRFAFAAQRTVVNQADDSQVMNAVTGFDLTTINLLHLVRSFRFSMRQSLTNFKMRFLRQSDNFPLKHFPSKNAWDNDDAAGVTITVPAAPPGETAPEALIRQRIELYPLAQENGTPFIFPSGLPIRIEWKADQPINANGNGTIPWHDVDIQDTTIRELADTGQLSIDSSGFDGNLNVNTNTIQSLAQAVNDLDISSEATVRSDEDIREVIGNALTEGSGIDISVDEQANTITISSIPKSDEEVRDVIGSALVAGSGIIINIDDLSGTITISTSGTIPPAQADSTNYLQFTIDNLVGSVDISTALSSDNLNPTFTLPALTENGYIQILQSMQHSEFSSISIGGLNQKGAFDVVDNARTVDSQQYRHYVSLNQLVGTVLSGQIIDLGGAS